MRDLLNLSFFYFLHFLFSHFLHFYIFLQKPLAISIFYTIFAKKV